MINEDEDFIEAVDFEGLEANVTNIDSDETLDNLNNLSYCTKLIHVDLSQEGNDPPTHLSHEHH